MMKLFLITFILGSALLFSCESKHSFREEIAPLKTHQVFKTALEKYRGKPLPVLEKINFAKALGRTPSQKELELGRMLFNDTILSRNNDVSCATCHLSNHGFADGNSITVGSGGQGGPTGDNVGQKFGEGELSLSRNLGDFSHGHLAHHFMFRNSLSTLNVAYRVDKVTNTGLFWDGRFGDLLFQVLLPIHTPEEMCGTNPIVKTATGKNPFRPGGTLFPEPITINHTNSYDEFTGLDTGNFNSQPVTIKGIPYRRRNNQISVPNRNECLALAISKLKLSPLYKKQFFEVYGELGVSDKTLAMALQAFIFTHVADDSPYDRFIRGEASLTKKELLGMVQFFTKANEEVTVGNETITGAGCISCHNGPQFGGEKFANIGVRSDIRSPLSQGAEGLNEKSGFFDRPRVQRGLTPECHIKDITVSRSGYAPDIGHASVSLKKSDCFKMRVPPLRNVVETFPYFHHGTENLRGQVERDPLRRSLKALDNVTRYHLRGVKNIKQINRMKPLEPFYDPMEQIDFLIPYYSMSDASSLKLTPVNYTSQQRENLLHFIAFGLWDREAVKRGALGNKVSHPKKVFSGLSPSISRDNGTQLDFPAQLSSP